MSSTDSVDPNFKLHVSFAEADIEFVDPLLGVLGDIDRFDLSVTPGGQEDAKDWVHRAGGLIEAADAIVYVLSPISIKLPTIAYEAERANALSKRSVPIIAQPLGRAGLPDALSGLRPLRMETQELYNGNLRSLLRLLDKDAGWIRMHTQLYLRARSWRDNGHDAAFLMSRAEVAAAKAWTFERPASAPKPIDLHMEFIKASEAAPMALQSDGRRAQQPAGPQRARRKPKPAVPARQAATIEAAKPVEAICLPAEEPACKPDDFNISPELNGLLNSLPAEPEATPNDAENDALLASPAPADTGSAKSQPDNEAVMSRPSEDEAEPKSPAVKKPAKRKAGLWKLKRKAKTRAKTIASDLETPACAPEDLAISRELNGQLNPLPAEPEATPHDAENDALLASLAPDDTGNAKSQPDIEAAVSRPSEDEAEPKSPAVKKPARRKAGLWKLKRTAKTRAKTITSDRDKPVCVPEDLNTSSEPNGQLNPPPAVSNDAEDEALFTGPTPADTGNTKSQPDNEAVMTMQPEDVAAPQSPAVKKPARRKAGLWKLKRKSKTRAKTIASDLETPACVPEDLNISREPNGQLSPPPAVPNDAEEEALFVGPAPADTGNAKLQPDIEAAMSRQSEDVAAPQSPAVKKPAWSKAGLWKFKRKSKASAKSIIVDLDKLAYVPENLKISRVPDGHLFPPPADRTTGSNGEKQPTDLARPAAAVPDDTGYPEAPQDYRDAEIRPTDNGSAPEAPAADRTAAANASPLKSPPKPKTEPRAHPVVIAQDELDGLLSSLLAEADSDRS